MSVSVNEQQCEHKCGCESECVTMWAGVSMSTTTSMSLIVHPNLSVINNIMVQIDLNTSSRLILNEYRHHHEKTSYVSNYAFFTLLHEWVDRGQTHRLEKLLCVKFQFYH